MITSAGNLKTCFILEMCNLILHRFLRILYAIYWNLHINITYLITIMNGLITSSKLLDGGVISKLGKTFTNSSCPIPTTCLAYAKYLWSTLDSILYRPPSCSRCAATLSRNSLKNYSVKLEPREKRRTSRPNE